MNTLLTNRCVGTFLTSGLAVTLALGSTGCGHKKKSGKNPPVAVDPGRGPTQEPAFRRIIKDPEPIVALAPRWIDFGSVTPSFPLGEQTVVPIDMESIGSQLTFDVAGKTAVGQATLTFVTLEDGLPMLDLAGDVTAVALDGASLPTEDFVTTVLPDLQSTVRVLRKPLIKGEKHTLTLSYRLRNTTTSFSETGVSFGFFMSDLRGPADAKHYLERYVPSNFEYDQFRLQLDISVLNGSAPLQLFTNGAVQSQEAQRWQITFPEYFTSSSPYLHLTETSMLVKDDVYQGMERSFPIKVYGSSETVLSEALAVARGTLQELEADYGAYPHESLLIYLNESMRGGMEYSGATATSLWALPHEITHSWFARSVMPADGNSGWIDEAIASWRDDHYPRYKADTIWSRLPELAAGSLFQRYTNYAAYTSGADLLSSIDHVLEKRGQAGLKPILSKLYKERKNQIITTPYFQKFIEGETQLDFSDYFAAYAFEKNAAQPAVTPSRAQKMVRMKSPYHAPALTEQDLKNIL